VINATTTKKQNKTKSLTQIKNSCECIIQICCVYLFLFIIKVEFYAVCWFQVNRCFVFDLVCDVI